MWSHAEEMRMRWRDGSQSSKNSAPELLKPAGAGKGKGRLSPRDVTGMHAALETPEFELCFPVLKKVNFCYIKSFSSCRIATIALRELAETDIKLTFCLETCLRFDSHDCLKVLFVLTSSFPTPATLPHHALPKGKRRKSIIFTLTISVHNVTTRTYLSIIGNVLLIIKMANCFLSTWVVFLVLLL